MAQAAASASKTFAWTLRVFDSIPVAAGWTGAMLVAVLYALFLVVEAALGRTPIRLEGDFLAHNKDALITLLLCALLAYLCAASVSAVREAPREAGRVRHLLEGSARELDALEVEAGKRSHRALLVAGIVGVLLALLAPFLEMGQGTGSPYDWRTWSPESTSHRILTPWIGWWTGRLVALMLIDSRHHSELARRIAAINLLDLRPLLPFTRLGLSNALRVVGIAAIFSLLLVDVARYGVMVLIFAALAVASATAALLLPVRGVHLRIRAAKLDELDRVNRAILGDAEALQESALAKREAMPSLADLVAYRSLVDAAREWPFDASTVRRFGLYMLIPLGSWLGGALVERLIDGLLE
jgi:hypothetical protein